MRHGLSEPYIIVRSLPSIERETLNTARIVVVDLTLLNQPALDAIEIHFLNPAPRNVLGMKVVVAFLEHLEREVFVSNDDESKLVEISDADVAPVLGSPVVVSPPQRETRAFCDVRFG